MLPNLIIIGAMKAGTTSLHAYLDLHPDISMSRQKELDFFIEQVNWGKGLDWYRSHFTSDTAVRGEASPNYTAYPFFPGVPERMQSVVPDAKLIYILRDPIERMISQHVHSIQKRRTKISLEEALVETNTHYYVRSSYAMQLERFLAYYDLKNILILTNEDLLIDRAGSLAETFRFLGVDDTFRSSDFDRIMHSSSAKRELTATGEAVLRLYGATQRFAPFLEAGWKRATARKRNLLSRTIERPVVGPAVRAMVAERMADDVARLRELTGKRFEHWSI